MNFIFEYLLIYASVLFAMSYDNYFWIPRDYKWYGTKEWKPHFKYLFMVKKREYFLIPQTQQGWQIIGSRVKAVITDPYDLIPAFFTAWTILGLIKLIF